MGVFFSWFNSVIILNTKYERSAASVNTCALSAYSLAGLIPNLIKLAWNSITIRRCFSLNVNHTLASEWNIHTTAFLCEMFIRTLFILIAKYRCLLCNKDRSFLMLANDLVFCKAESNLVLKYLPIPLQALYYLSMQTVHVILCIPYRWEVNFFPSGQSLGRFMRIPFIASPSVALNPLQSKCYLIPPCFPSSLPHKDPVPAN